MIKRNKITLRGKSNWRAIGTLVVITVCLVSVMSPVMTQSSLSLFSSNASNATDGEKTEPAPAATPTPSPSPTPGPTPTLMPTPAPTPTPMPSPSPVAPSITSFAPHSPISNTEGETITFAIITDQTVNVSWLLNGTEVQINTSVKNASYTNTSPIIGSQNITAIASNENGTVVQTWIWNVLPVTTPTPSPTPCPTPSPSPIIITLTPKPSPKPSYTLSSDTTLTPFYIFGWVYYNDSACNYPFVTVTNLNTNEKKQAETHQDSNFFQTVISASEGDVLLFNATDGEKVNTTKYKITAEDKRSGLFYFNLMLEPPSGNPDLTVIEIYTGSEEPVWGDVLNVTARIEKRGNITANTTSALFLDEKNISISKSYSYTTSNSSDTWNDTISQPGTLKIRVHFSYIDIHGAGSYIKIYNASDELIHNFTTTDSLNKTNFWTNWSTGGAQIRIESHATENINFTIDRYESVFANESLTLPSWQSKDIKAEWNASAWLNNDTDLASGSHTILVSVDPLKLVNESDETNNNMSVQITVHKGPDFAVTNLMAHPRNPEIGDVVELNATIANFGNKTFGNKIGFTSVVFYDNKRIELKRTRGYYKTINDTLTIPEALQIRVHFSYIYGPSRIKIYDKNGSVIEEFNWSFWEDRSYKDITDYWTEWASGDTIRIESQSGEFTIDRYEAVLAKNESIPLLDAGNSTPVYAELNLSDQYMGWALNGTHNITAMVDPYDDIDEQDEENNTYTTSILVTPSLDFAVTNVSFNEPLLNETVELNATVANYGDRTGTATVRAYCDDIIVNETAVSLNFTDLPRVVDMWWVANITNGGAGRHNISVEIDPDNVFVELNETNNTLPPQEIFVNGTDLAVTDREIPCGQFGGRRCYRDKNETITVTIANLGARDASNFTVMLSDGLGKGNTSGTVFFNKTIPRLNSGDNRSINVTWSPAEFGKHTITVSIPFDNMDNNETNNKLFENISVKPEYDFAVEDVRVSPVYIKEGGNVTINTTIANLGLKDGSVNVSFYVNSTDFVGSKDERYIEIGRTGPVDVESDKNKSVPITWRANITGGDHLIYVVVDPDNKVAEWPGDFTKVGESIILKDPAKAGNNVKSCLLHVLSPQLHIANLTLDPSKPVIENKVNVTAVIENKGNETANSTVGFYIEKNLGIRGKQYEAKDWDCLISQPEDLPIRVHLKHIRIRGDPSVSINAYSDAKLVNFIVKSIDVAKGQPIKVSEINLDSPCGDCKVHNANGICTERRWEDVWTEWAVGKTIEVKAKQKNKRCTFEFLIDKYQVKLGNENVNSNSSYNATWNASLPLKVSYNANLGPAGYGTIEESLVGKNHTLIANVEDEVATNETYLYGTDLAVTDLEVNKTYFDGDEVNITAVIENLGLKNATGFWVNLTEYYINIYGHPVTVETKPVFIKGLNASEDVPPVNWTLNASRRWKQDYTIEVKIKPLNNTKYEEKTNNNLKEKKDVHVKRSRDFYFSIQNLSFAMNNETLDAAHLTPGINVTVNATLNITNLANRGGKTDVSFYVDRVDNAREIGNESVEFVAGNGTSHAEITWYLWDFDDVKIGGNHTFIVVADPENNIDELNESNNTYIQPIHVNAPELTITNITFEPEPDKKEINESVKMNISVGVANYGDKNATNVSLVVYECANRHIENTDSRVYGSLHPGQDKAQIKRENATAMRLYLDLDLDIDIDSGKVSIRDGRGGQIELMEDSGVIFKNELSYYDDFHGWTPWIIGNNLTIEAMGNASARVSKVYYLKPSEDATNTIYNLSVNRTEEKIIPIFDNWTAPTVGERLIVATIDPEKKIQEYNELNNTFARYITKKTKDLAVHDIGLRWLNGTQIGENDTVRDNDTVRIVANITNIGVNETENFSVRMLIDDDELLNETANWTATVGKHVLKAEVDYGNEIDETNETNNIAAMEIYVHGAEVRGNATWKSEGLHGLTGTILFDPAQPYDEDNVNISAVINNSGEVNATNFSLALLFDYKPANTYPPVTINNQLQNSFFGLKTNNTISYGNAISIYVYIDTHNKTLLRKTFGRVDWHQVLTVYDKNNTEVARTDETRWVHVPGDTIKIRRFNENELFPYNISFYPIYKSNLTRDENLTLNANTNSSTDVSITAKNVTAGNHTVMLLIDPKRKVPEDVDDKTDNIVTREMAVLPTRDFTVTEVIPETENISDVEKINITANVTNIGLKEIAEKLSNKSIHLNLSCLNVTAKVYRNGTAKVRFVDYETKTRIHKYYLNNSLPEFLHLSDNRTYLPVLPGETLLDSRKNLTIIHRPGADAIKLNFSSIAFNTSKQPLPKIQVFNKTGTEILSANTRKVVRVFNGDTWDYHKLGPTESLLSIVNKNLCPGDTAYIYTINTNFNLRGYTTMKEFHETDVTLNASVAWDESGNITDLCGESKNIPALWNASTGTHNITVTIDPDDETSEINETNNTYVRTLSVNATKELEIVDLNYSVQNPAPGQDPWHPGHGDNVTITAVVRNSGTAPANFSADLWMEVIKDNISSAPPNDWNFSLGERSIQVGGKTMHVKRIKYIKLFNHTEISLLAPGEKNVTTATWTNISVYGNPEYAVKAIVDPLGEIEEKNESNNEMEREIRMNYPDLTVRRFSSPTREDKNASVEIANEGVRNASNINVSLEMIKHEYRTLRTGILNITNDTIAINITMKGASRIRVHFASLDTTGGNSYIDIIGVDERGNPHLLKTYRGVKLENEWTPWWDGDSMRIDYTNANFYIDGYGCGNVYSKEGASKIRICFNSLDTAGVNSYIDILDGEDNRVKTYSNEETGYVCAPWVDGNTTRIDYANAFYDVKELWWKEEAIRKIEELNASDSKNITLLEGGKYERLMSLNVSVDPPDVEHLYGGVIEQREDNNIGTALIYADLIPKAMNLDYYTDGGQLKGVNATIANDKTLSEDEGIAYPVYDFNVSLEVRPWNNDTVVYEDSKWIDENQTIYGGEVQNVTFDINESELRRLGLENKTCKFTVVADSKQEYSWGEIEEINEGNNEYPVTVGPDLSVGDIYTITDDSCNCYVGAVIKNEGKLRATDFDVRLILNSTTKNWNETGYETVVSLSPSPIPPKNETKLIFDENQVKVKPNEIYNVEVIADPDNKVEELNEGNNENEPNPERIGPDLSPRYGLFYRSKSGERVQLDKVFVGENFTVKIMVENAGKVSAANFSVAINASNVTQSSVTVPCLPGGEKGPVELFNWAMPQRGFYSVSATVDIPDNVVNETDEGNNTLPPTLVKVAEPNYRATKPLTVSSDTVYGGVFYDASGSLQTYSNPSGNYSTTFDNKLPKGATPVHARLYLYLMGWKEDPEHPGGYYKLGELPKITATTFNSEPVTLTLVDKEFPDATHENYTYATYACNIPSNILSTIDANASLEVNVIFDGTGVKHYEVPAMGLFVAYNDYSNGLLTKYYIGEGGDVIMAKNEVYPTGFEYDECTSRVEFNGVDDPQLANATLITVLAYYNFYEPIEKYNGKLLGDLLLFNDKEVGEPIFELSGEGHYWKYQTVGKIALIKNEEIGERGEYVDVEANNVAKIQSRGNYFFLTNAFLNVTWWPDLEPYVETQLKATVGNPYDIEVVINNWGLSKAKGFNVSVSIDGEEYNETIDDEIEGAVGYQQQPGTKTLTFTKKAPLVECIVTHNVTVDVDPEDKVKELINKYHRGKQGKSNGEENNNITEKVTVVVNPPGLSRYPGGGGGTGGGWGEGTGTGEGSGSGAGKGVAGGTGQGTGESGGKTITGRLMKGVVVPGGKEAGGGGKGEFSFVRFLMQLVMLAAALALVGIGYLLERRRQRHEQ